MPTALIVDDEPQAAQLLARVVALRGYETRIAPDAATARRLIGEQRPDLVLLDLMLPDESGVEVCRRLKTDPESRHIPVIIVTARRLEQCRDDCLQAGASLIVTKPYTPDQIFRALEQAGRPPTGV